MRAQVSRDNGTHQIQEKVSHIVRHIVDLIHDLAERFGSVGFAGRSQNPRGNHHVGRQVKRIIDRRGRIPRPVFVFRNVLECSLQLLRGRVMIGDRIPQPMQ